MRQMISSTFLLDHSHASYLFLDYIYVYLILRSSICAFVHIKLLFTQPVLQPEVVVMQPVPHSARDSSCVQGCWNTTVNWSRNVSLLSYGFVFGGAWFFSLTLHVLLYPYLTAYFVANGCTFLCWSDICDCQEQIVLPLLAVTAVGQFPADNVCIFSQRRFFSATAQSFFAGAARRQFFTAALQNRVFISCVLWCVSLCVENNSNKKTINIYSPIAWPWCTNLRFACQL